ncbi:MAG: ATP-grasp domain-containing protein [Patescibacteria group bacterium]
MKKIAVFFDQPNFDDYPFSENEWRQAYGELAKIIHARGGTFFIARGDATYLGGMKFSQGWQWDGREFREVGEFQPDVIYDKSNSAVTPPFRFEANARILNPNPIVEVCNDKFKTYQIFSEFAPPTEIALDEKQVATALGKIKSQQKVLKPLNAEGGAGVVIGDDATILAAEKFFPVLIQEFIDTAAGLSADDATSHHDFRIVVVNGEIVLAGLRIPAAGKLIANISQGGTVEEFPLEKIPPAALKLVKKIDAKFASYDRAYSIDLGFENNEPKLIELNSQPGLFSKKRGPDFANFQEKLAEVLLKLA